jgi:hypothetical protein
MVAFSLIVSATLMLFILAGIHWGPLGIASAHVCTMVVLTLPKLFYSFRQTPVTVRLFLDGIGTASLASGAMVASLLVFRMLVGGDGRILSLISGIGVAGTTYATVLLLLPRCRKDLNTLRSDILAALQRRRPAAAAEKVEAVPQ